MKRLLVTLFSVVIICGSTLQAQENRSLFDRYCGFMLYENAECSYYTLYGECTIEGIDYIKEEHGRYAYRQEGNKVYCYSFAEGKESLVMDFGLEVGDLFTLYEGFDVVVEQKSDTLLTCWDVQMVCKKLLLRGVERPDFTDTWIEGIGSLHYGVNPPKAEETYLLHSSLYMGEGSKDYSDCRTFIFEFHKDDLYATMVTLGEEVHEDAFSDYNEYMEAHENKMLTFDLRNDTLHIGGYIGTYCEQSLYFLIEEGVGTIHITSIPFPLAPEADCRSVNRIDANFPGFTQKEYTIYCMGREVVVGQPAQRFFPANSIRCLNAMIFNYAEDEAGNMIEISPDTVYLEIWTGNDTIVDGKECVVLWKEIGRDISEYGYYVGVKPNVPLYDGVIYEAESGHVYFRSRYDDSGWTILYDFSDSDWEIGDSLYVFDDDFDGPFFEVIRSLSTYTLCNGEEVPVANGLMYGIGYDYRPFFTPMYMVNAYSPKEIPVEFYRDGALLYQRFKRGNPHNGIDKASSQTYSYDYYDLQGRPVANPTRGIYIKDGRKIVVD